MLNSIYIETSIPSFYYTLRTDPETIARKHWTHQWWNENAKNSILTTSLAVIAELRKGTSEKTTKRLNFLNNMELLPITKEITKITHIYIDRFIMPKDPR